MKPLEINYGTQAQIASYAGVSGYLAQPVWATDEHRLYVFNGSTTGGYAVAMKADLSAYLTTSAASTTYLGINAKAVSAGTADSATNAQNAQNAVNAQSAVNATNAESATKASQDGDGNNIVATYAKKSDVTPITSGTEDLEAGTSSLATGSLYFMYE